MFFPIIRNSEQNLHYKMLILGEELPSLTDAVEKPVDVTDLFPMWIRDRSESNNPSNHMIKFVQSYYDWLYDKSGYELSTTTFTDVGLRRLIDIDETPSEFLKLFVKTYASGFPEWYVGATASIDGSSTESYVRKFIKNIRRGLYQRKSTEEAYQYFFESLFDEPDVELSYPKTNILRLNGGRFGDWTVNDTDGSGGGFLQHGLVGSYLNGPYKLQDSNWYQDFSYILKAGVSVVDPKTGLPIYYDALQGTLHPAGLKGFFEKSTQDYVPPDNYEGGIDICEDPALKNYFPYRMKSNSSIELCFGCTGSGYTYAGPTAMALGLNGSDLSTLAGGTFGWTYGDMWSGVGAGSIPAEYNEPTHAHPSWTENILDSIGFEDIYISDMSYLCPSLDSPNLGITGCTAYGDAGGGACWS